MAPLFAAFVEIHVTFRPPRQEARVVQVPEGATAGDVVRAAGESIDVVLVLRGNDIIIEAEPVVDGEALTLLSAASGG